MMLRQTKPSFVQTPSFRVAQWLAVYLPRHRATTPRPRSSMEWNPPIYPLLANHPGHRHFPAIATSAS